MIGMINFSASHDSPGDAKTVRFPYLKLVRQCVGPMEIM
jgi:hypothetical protein